MSERDDLFSGLRRLAEAAFPKRCANCGRVYETAEAFLRETARVRPEISGLRSAVDDELGTVVEAYRNCACGSTLMDLFNDRRDASERGARRRAQFESLLSRITAHGVDRDRARTELLKMMRGEGSDLINGLFGRPPGGG